MSGHEGSPAILPATSPVPVASDKSASPATERNEVVASSASSQKQDLTQKAVVDDDQQACSACKPDHLMSASSASCEAGQDSSLQVGAKIEQDAGSHYEPEDEPYGTPSRERQDVTKQGFIGAVQETDPVSECDDAVSSSCTKNLRASQQNQKGTKNNPDGSLYPERGSIASTTERKEEHKQDLTKQVEDNCSQYSEHDLVLLPLSTQSKDRQDSSLKIPTTTSQETTPVSKTDEILSLTSASSEGERDSSLHTGVVNDYNASTTSQRDDITRSESREKQRGPSRKVNMDRGAIPEGGTCLGIDSQPSSGGRPKEREMTASHQTEMEKGTPDTNLTSVNIRRRQQKEQPRMPRGHPQRGNRHPRIRGNPAVYESSMDSPPPPGPYSPVSHASRGRGRGRGRAKSQGDSGPWRGYGGDSPRKDTDVDYQHVDPVAENDEMTPFRSSKKKKDPPKRTVAISDRHYDTSSESVGTITITISSPETPSKEQDPGKQLVVHGGQNVNPASESERSDTTLPPETASKEQDPGQKVVVQCDQNVNPASECDIIESPVTSSKEQDPGRKAEVNGNQEAIFVSGHGDTTLSTLIKNQIPAAQDTVNSGGNSGCPIDPGDVTSSSTSCTTHDPAKETLCDINKGGNPEIELAKRTSSPGQTRLVSYSVTGGPQSEAGKVAMGHPATESPSLPQEQNQETIAAGIFGHRLHHNVKNPEDGKLQHADQLTSFPSTPDDVSSTEPMLFANNITIPPNIFKHILSFLSWQELSGAKRVSRSWKDAADACQAQRMELRISRFDPPATLEDETLETLLRSMPALRRLSVEWRLDGRKLDIDVVSRHCRNLVELDLTRFRLDTWSLQQLCIACPKLEVIKLPRKCDDTFVEVLLRNLPHLRSLDLQDTQVTGQFLRQSHESLEKISLAGCSSLKVESLRSLQHSSEDIFLEVNCWKNVQDLDLSSTTIIWEDLVEILKVFPGLERLSLARCSKLESASLTQVALCEHLRDLDISHVGSLQVSDLLAVLIIPRLERLSLAGCTIVGSACLLFPSLAPLRLRELDVSGVRGLTAVNLTAILTRSPQLECLLAAQLDKLDMSACLTQLSRCADLRELDVSRLGTFHGVQTAQLEKTAAGSSFAKGIQTSSTPTNEKHDVFKDVPPTHSEAKPSAGRCSAGNIEQKDKHKSDFKGNTPAHPGSRKSGHSEGHFSQANQHKSAFQCTSCSVSQAQPETKPQSGDFAFGGSKIKGRHSGMFMFGGSQPRNSNSQSGDDPNWDRHFYVSRLINPISFTALLSGCPKLERIVLAGCHISESVSLRRLAQCPELRELDLSRVTTVRADDLARGLSGCPLLERLSVAELKTPLEQLVPLSGLPCLEYLDASQSGLTSNSLRRIPGLFPRLHTLIMQGCTSVSEDGLMSYLPRLRNLRSLDLRNLPSVGGTVLNKLKVCRLTELKLGPVGKDRLCKNSVRKLALRNQSLKFLWLETQEDVLNWIVGMIKRQLSDHRVLVICDGSNGDQQSSVFKASSRPSNVHVVNGNAATWN